MGSKLYGTTVAGGATTVSGCYYLSCGTVFSITLNGKEKMLHSFGTRGDGHNPEAGLIDVGGTLYGTTSSGGSAECVGSGYGDCGAVFAMTPSGAEKLLYSFSGPPDGEYPFGGLIDVKGMLYGTTVGGGQYSCRFSCTGGGTVFSITPSGTESVVYSFHYNGGEDGNRPYAGVIDVGGTLYGTTQSGGQYKRRRLCGGCGTVFSVTLGGNEKVLHSFGQGMDGTTPVASLIKVNGTLYGTTQYGGAYGSHYCTGGCGTVFSITPSGQETVLHSFGSGTDGKQPKASLIEVNGTLYGTTQYGGAYRRSYCGGGCGTVFSITPSGTETVLHSFGSGTDGSNPVAALTDVNGTLYGTTRYGGGHNTNCDRSCGTIFEITP